MNGILSPEKDIQQPQVPEKTKKAGLVASMLTFKEVLPFCGMENLHDTWCYQPCQIQEQCDSRKPSSTVRR